MIHLIRTLCIHSTSMKVCGKILNIFYQNMDKTVACKQISEILNHDYVYDLEGTMLDFLNQLNEIADPVGELLSNLFRVDEYGKLIPLQESDEDENGNLM